MADFFIAEPFAVRVSLALSLVALVIVALAENARIPVDNPVTHLELTMVHEAMVLEYSGRHLALIEAASHPQAGSLHLPADLPVRAVRHGAGQRGRGGLADRPRGVDGKLLFGAALLGVWEVSIAKMRVFRLPDFVGIAFVFGFLAILLAFLTRGRVRSEPGLRDLPPAFRRHACWSSFALLYQERIAAVLNAFAAAVDRSGARRCLGGLVAGNRPDLFITALIAFTLKGIVIPVALRRTVTRLGIHREVEKVVGVGVALLVGLALTGLAQALVVKVASGTASHAREELAHGARHHPAGLPDDDRATQRRRRRSWASCRWRTG